MGDKKSRAAEVRKRLSEADKSAPSKCGAWGCKQQTQSTAGTGLSETFCKQHVEFQRRHGSTWRKSYSKAELAPYRSAAVRWLKEHKGESFVIRAADELQSLIANSGQPISAYSLRWQTSEDKARVALARLREAGKTGWKLLEIALTLKAAYAAMGPRGNPEFLHVQIAKLTKRLAGGTHRTTSGFPITPKYPRAEGNFMRILGGQIEHAAAHGIDTEAVEEVLDLTRTL